MKIEWLVADVTVVRSPGRAEHEMLGMILNVFRPVPTSIMVGVGGLFVSWEPQLKP